MRSNDGNFSQAFIIYLQFNGDHWQLKLKDVAKGFFYWQTFVQMQRLIILLQYDFKPAEIDQRKGLIWLKYQMLISPNIFDTIVVFSL